MNHTNIGHDVILGNNVVVSNGAQIGGFSVIDDNVNLGLNCCIHQKCFVGAFSIIGMNTSVKNDIEPFSMIYQDKKTINIVGIKRSKYAEQIAAILKLKRSTNDIESPIGLVDKKIVEYFKNYKERYDEFTAE